MAKYPKTLGRIEAVWNKLGGEEGVDRFLRGELAVSENKTTAPSFVHDKTKDGWTLLADVGRSIVSVRVELVPFLKDGEDYVNGEEMARRATDLGADFGQKEAEFLLGHQDEIPAEFRKYYLVFPGTVWRVPGGNRLVPYLNWDGYRWFLSFYWLGYGWCSNDRLLRLRK